MISDQDKGIRKSERSNTSRKRDLRRFINDTVVKLSSGEQCAVGGMIRQTQREADCVTHWSMDKHVVATI